MDSRPILQKLNKISVVAVAVVSRRLSSSVVFAVVAGQQAFGQSFSAVPSPGQIDPFYTQGLVVICTVCERYCWLLVGMCMPVSVRVLFVSCDWPVTNT